MSYGSSVISKSLIMFKLITGTLLSFLALAAAVPSKSGGSK